MTKVTALNFLSYILFFLGLSFGGMIQAQSLERLPVEISQNGTLLKFGAVGGIKSPQISMADLDNDGDEDIFIFDKTGDVISTFRNDGGTDNLDYTYAPELKTNFPPLVHWAMLRDYNGDGIADIFAELNSGLAQGIEVWTGKWQGNKLAFDQVAFPELSVDAIPIPSGGGNFTQLYVSREDIPGIEDLDGDGDLDILTFSPVGGVIYHFDNKSIENGSGSAGLQFLLEDDCWGRFFESGITGCLEISPNPNECSDGFSGGGDDRSGGVHAGSTVGIIDNDGDGDMDIVLGDITFNNAVLALNDPAGDIAYINSQDCEFPSYDTPIDMVIFPATYFVDVNKDGKKDMLVSPNTENNGEDLTGLWYFENESSTNAADFNLKQKDFLIDQMWDGGRGANPAFVDYNADGLLDLVVGNHGYFVSGGGRDSRLQLFLNTGTETSPRFDLVDDDWLGFKDLFFTTPSVYNFAPTFADIDGDDDLDMLVGEQSGRLIFCENTAGPGATLEFSSPEYNWMGLKAGQMTVPTVVDVNRDGLLDIILGEKNVNSSTDGSQFSSFNLFTNNGTATEPSFSPDQTANGNSAFFGGVITQDLGFSSAQSAPAIWDTGNDFLLFSGASSGKVKVFTDIEDNLDGIFTTRHTDYGALGVGTETRLAVADINADGILEMAIGNKRGGIDFFVTDFKTDGGSTGVNDLLTLEGIKVFPNPAQDVLHITQESSDVLNCQLFDALGRNLLNQKLSDKSNQIILSSLSSGIYFLTITSNGKVYTERVVVQ